MAMDSCTEANSPASSSSSPSPSSPSSAVDVLPGDMIALCFLFLPSFKDLALASRVCRKWRVGVKCALMYKRKLSFSGCRVDDECVARLVEGAHSLHELDISSSRWGCNITDIGLKKISLAPCCPNLTSISLWGVSAITDDGVIQLVSKAVSLEHLNIGGTFITDDSLFAIATHCQNIKVLNLWGCRHVTEKGIMALGSGCPKLCTINVWGLNISVEYYKYLLSMKPHLQLKTGSAQRLTNTLLPYLQVAY